MQTKILGNKKSGKINLIISEKKCEKNSRKWWSKENFL